MSFLNSNRICTRFSSCGSATVDCENKKTKNARCCWGSQNETSQKSFPATRTKLLMPAAGICGSRNLPNSAKEASKETLTPSTAAAEHLTVNQKRRSIFPNNGLSEPVSCSFSGGANGELSSERLHQRTQALTLLAFADLAMQTAEQRVTNASIEAIVQEAGGPMPPCLGAAAWPDSIHQNLHWNDHRELTRHSHKSTNNS
jgi:hypothetical protein